MESGANYLKVVGYIKNPKLWLFDNDVKLFTCSIDIPVIGSNKLQTISGFKAWGQLGEELSLVGDDTMVKIVAHVESSVYSKNCRLCNDAYKVYDKEFIIDLFSTLER